MSTPDEKMRAINLAEIINKSNADRPLRQELLATMAREKKDLFDAFVGVGFTSEQALHLMCGGKL